MLQLMFYRSYENQALVQLNWLSLDWALLKSFTSKTNGVTNANEFFLFAIYLFIVFIQNPLNFELQSNKSSFFNFSPPVLK